MDKVIIITGASRGIGAATAIAAGKAGYRVVVNYTKRGEEAEGVVRDIVENGGCRPGRCRHRGRYRAPLRRDRPSLRPARRAGQQCRHRRPQQQVRGHGHS
jgi:NAD(P)-dependent dehydrogenase (short-subunit alcohol dehydrogenase family)